MILAHTGESGKLSEATIQMSGQEYLRLLLFCSTVGWRLSCIVPSELEEIGGKLERKHVGPVFRASPLPRKQQSSLFINDTSVTPVWTFQTPGEIQSM